MFLHQKVNRTVNQVVDDRRDCKYAPNNSNNVYEKSVPLILVNYIQHSHWIRLIFEINHWKLAQNHFV